MPSPTSRGGSNPCHRYEPSKTAHTDASLVLAGRSRNPEAEVARILADPVEWARLFLVTRTGGPLVPWPHQAEELRDPARFIVHQDGCEVGKTICIVVDALHFAFITQGGLGLIVAPLQGHLDTIIDEIEFQISHSPDLRDSIARTPSGRLKIKRKPYFQVEFSSGSVLYFRPAGTDGSAYDSLHVHRIWVDQAATIPERAWQVLFSRLLPGGRIKVYSYPDGRRDTTEAVPIRFGGFVDVGWVRSEWQAPTHQAGCVHAKRHPGGRISRQSQRIAARSKKKRRHACAPSKTPSPAHKHASAPHLPSLILPVVIIHIPLLEQPHKILTTITKKAIILSSFRGRESERGERSFQDKNFLDTPFCFITFL